MSRRTGRTWSVVKGPSQDKIIFAILYPDNNITFTLTVKEKDSGEEFTITVEVDDLWAGTSSQRGTKKRPWDGSCGFSGTTYSSRLVYDLAAQLRVSVTYQIGKEIGELKLSSID